MTKKEDKTFFRTVRGQKARVHRKWGALCTIIRVAKHCEGPGGQHLADFATLPHAVVKVVSCLTDPTTTLKFHYFLVLNSLKV